MEKYERNFKNSNLKSDRAGDDTGNPSCFLKAVIFDMDGVLIDTESLHFEAIRSIFEERGYTYTVSDLHRYCGVPEIQIWPKLLRDLDAESLDPDEMMREHWVRFSRSLEDGLPEFPGLPDCLEKLQADGIRIAVASASAAPTIERFLRELGIERYFDAVVSADDCKNGKPDPEIFLLAAKRMDVDPSSCLVVEDSVKGMMAAKRAGMTWVGFDGAEVSPDLHLAPVTFDDYREVGAADFRRWHEAETLKRENTATS